MVRRLRATFDAGTTRPLDWRRRQLRMMVRLLGENRDAILDAMVADMRKPRAEAWMADVGHVAAEIAWMERRLARLTGERRAPLALHLRPGRAWVVREPLGVALVVAPWNYPVQLLLLPMAGAVAAGNAVVGKPSEVTLHTSTTLARLWPRYLDTEAVALVEGGGEQTRAIIDAHVDHVFFTGGARVAREVMAAAARHLTPVTLELGGKSPAIVDRDADLRVAARRIAWGRFLNAGQTCIAPDHVLVHRDVEGALLHHLVSAVRSFYGDDPRRSPDFARIVNDTHLERLRRLLDAGGYDEVVAGGEVDAAERYVAPTILRGVREDAALMQEEIFGPILPVIAVDDVDAAIKSVRSRPSPLAVYLFSRSRDTERRVLARTSSGGVSVNGGIVHAGVRSLPFGGVGESGMGAYHGRHTVDTFSRPRAVLRKPFRPDPSVPYPPYTRWKQRLVERFL